MIFFRDVSVTFPSQHTALEGVTFYIRPNALVFITGKSGSGKTSLMKLLTTEYRPTNGSVLFNGTDLATLPSHKTHHHRRKIGVIFQDYHLLPELNVWENIALPLSIANRGQEADERVTDLLNLVELTDKAFLFPHQLSGGEAQRVSIARALAAAPDVLFADEPTGNLDAETGAHIAEILVKINELGTTLLFATHDLSFLKRFPKHHHLELKQGKVTTDSRPPSEEERAQHTPAKKTSFWERFWRKQPKQDSSKPSLVIRDESIDDQTKDTASTNDTLTHIEPINHQKEAQKKSKKTTSPEPAASAPSKTRTSDKRKKKTVPSPTKPTKPTKSQKKIAS
jgi:cell division transport system ATP-binding protein